MKVIIDPFKIYHPSKHILSVISESSYVKSRATLLTYFSTGNKDFENIYVTEHPFTQWYSDLEEYTQLIKPLNALKEKFPQTILPDGLTDSDVINLNLLEISIEPSENEILKYFLNINLPLNLNASAVHKTVYNLAQSVITHKRAFDDSYLIRIWQKKINKSAADVEHYVRDVLQPVLELDESYCFILMTGIYASKSEAFQRHWIEDSVFEFHKRSISIESIERFISGMHISLPVNEQIELVLERFFAENLKSGRIAMFDLPGIYRAEIEALLSAVTKIDQLIYDQLLGKFSTIIDERQVLVLKRRIIPKLAEIPSLNGLSILQQAHLLKLWAVNSFIPFKFYYDEAETIDPMALNLIEKNAGQFGDWLFDNIGAILNEDEIYTNIDIIKTVKENMAENSSVIWLIIDGLAAHYSPALEVVLKSNGINRIQTNWSFATLPTITEVAIPITVSGKYGNSIDEAEYFNRDRLLQKAFPGKVAIYSSQPADFQSNLSKSFDVCCLHVRDIDAEMHKNEKDFYFGRTAEIEHHLEKYIGMVSSAIRREPERKITLLVSTDHGATKCLQNEQMIKNQKLNELALSRPRERCVPLIGELAIENWERQDIYMLSKTVSRNKFDWAIARGYKYFGRNDSGYRHGGLTPEEVVVPVIVGRIMELNTIKLSVQSIGSYELRFGKSERNFRLRIKNSNLNSIQISAVTISQEKDTIFELPVQVPASGEVDIKGTIKLHARLKSQAKNGILHLDLGIKYTSLGQQFEDVLNTQVFTEKDEFENDFL